MSTLESWVNRFSQSMPRFPHIVSLELFPEEPIYQRIKDVKEFRCLLLNTLINIHNTLSQHSPTITVTTQVESDKTQILVMPPKQYLEEEGMLQ